ncbi:hypothetical protein [Acinetobacter calcoaceticus]|uniref:hypothetical protein n=1 Tax=Acinetobacter calcoaceticus TaxID=471 RepID=UPI001AE8B7D5|nr:hypothetical protein [Acinetobacter calcoaceticus]MBP2605544.1 hypothetical protein [Acinetobacter calcoaceticus]
MNKKFSNIFAAIMTFVVVLAVYFLIRDIMEMSDKLDFTLLKYVVAFVGILFALVSTISLYLDSSKSSINTLNDFVNSNKYKKLKLYRELGGKNIEEGYSPVKKENNNHEVEEVTNLIRNKIESASTESYFKEFREKVKIEAIVEFFLQEAKSIETRVNGEINRLSKSAIINLSLGMMLSIGGILYLGSFVVNAQSFDSLEKMFINTFPKAIFVLLIEVFAYFFLKLYKQSLDDIKYYQNELTNIEYKNLAVHVSKQSNNHKLLTLCVEEFLSTERNFILEKDQSTIEIEKERINSNNTNNTLQVMKDIFKNKV